MEAEQSQYERRVIVIGVGLIGGSIAAAVRKRFPDSEVVGIGRSEKRLQAAADVGLLTSWATTVSRELLSSSAVVVNCLPVHLIADNVIEVASIASDDVLITDAGSVKGVICEQIDSDARARELFVAAHPIAGGEQGGFEFADADLFEDRVCVIVNSQDSDRTARAKTFWAGIGCRIMPMTATEHDTKLALTSHLPHVMAAVTTSVVGNDNLPLTGSGFRDATRIAAGDAALWRSILAGNRKCVVESIRSAEDALRKYRTLLEANDDQSVEELLRLAAECRTQLNGDS